MYFYSLNAVRLKNWDLAERSCKAFLKKYPDSDWKDHIRSVLKSKIPREN